MRFILNKLEKGDVWNPRSAASLTSWEDAGLIFSTASLIFGYHYLASLMTALIRKFLTYDLIKTLRLSRHYFYVALLPLDFISRLMNGKSELPPLHLRRYVGPLRSFEASGAEFTCYLRLLCNMQPTDRVLDIGCGCGLMALHLKDHIKEGGSYIGVDISHESIQWCNEKIARKNRGFVFEHIDVKSAAYNPTGKFDGSTFLFPFDSRSINLILLKSVFTHIGAAELDNYLREISRLLKSDGRCLATFFLLNTDQENFAQSGKGHLSFEFGAHDFRYVYKNSPESAIAYQEDFVLELLQKNNLRLTKPILYGRWSGREGGLSFQDILIIERCDFQQTAETPSAEIS